MFAMSRNVMENRRISVNDRRVTMNRCASETLLVHENDQPVFERRNSTPDRRLNSIVVEEIYYDASFAEIMQ